MPPAQRDEYLKTVLLGKSFELSGKIIGIETPILNMEIRLESYYLHELNAVQQYYYSDFNFDASLASQVSDFKNGDLVTCTGNLKHLSYYSCDFELTAINKYKGSVEKKIKNSKSKKYNQLFNDAFTHLEYIHFGT